MHGRRLAHLLALLLCIFAAPAIAQETKAVPVRVADAPCAVCHRDIYNSYLKTPMANASGAAAEKLLPGTYINPASSITYTITKDASLDWSIPFSPPAHGSDKLQYYLGSGHLGLTYLYEKNGYWLESPVAWYTKLAGYTMAPGLENSPQTPALPLNPTCLRCHMSAVQKQLAGSENLYQADPFQQVGITCESCHGDARAHVLSKGRAPVINPIKLTPEKRDSTCILCHLEGDTHVEHRGRNPLDFKPGEDISDYISYYVLRGQNTTKRAVSEIEQFNSSRCKIVSGPSMSCMNCHDPHHSPVAEERTAFYRAKCLTCHSAPAFAAEHFPDKPDCTGCHLPRTGSENIAHVAWTDHRIRREPHTEALSIASVNESSTSGGELVPIFAAPASTRDLGLAYYDLAVQGNRPAALKARPLLTAATRSDPADLQVLTSLGVLNQMTHEPSSSAGYYREVLKNNPASLVAATNLGIFLAASGDLQAAADLWTKAFTLNRDVPQLGRNLALTECRLGNKQSAVDILTEVLTYSPGLQEVRGLLQAISTGQQSCAAAPGSSQAVTN